MFSRQIISVVGAVACAFGAGFSGTQAYAQTSETPYWASISVSKVYMRVGPSMNYPIEWVYQREGLPVKVLRVNEGWRYVEDPDGMRGWMAARLLTRSRGAIVIGEDAADIRGEGSASAPLLWHVEPGVVGMLGECADGWCEFSARGHKGFVEAERLWGDGEP
ncbi:SH3 domain-containing protein [Aurantiacibacter suaedae]|uniref:SH3 domain-containing protein n=1 Tax=Aurantiacibacter suaedae TaxID=2545755 RepID=UPI0010F922C9|nr:SH3 domain-containing protein [Aurantiacibacter suaedae]